jgi:type IV secretory pathway protease TraF
MRSWKVVPVQDIGAFLQPHINKLFNNNILWLFLSIIPGLGHAAQGRFKEIRWYFWAWLALFLLGLFFYGSAAGYLLVGLAIGIHARIALYSGIIEDLGELKEKIATGIFVLISLALIYMYAPQAIIAGGPAGLTIPYYQIEMGDYLFGRRIFDHTVPLQRGTLVLIHPSVFRDHPHFLRGEYRTNQAVFVEIVGIAGERLQISGGLFYINGEQLDAEKYPVPEWLHNTTMSATIPANNYFVNVLYNVSGYQVDDIAQHNLEMRRAACLVESRDIEARAFLYWWPLSRRGFIKVD